MLNKASTSRDYTSDSESDYDDAAYSHSETEYPDSSEELSSTDRTRSVGPSISSLTSLPLIKPAIGILAAAEKLKRLVRKRPASSSPSHLRNTITTLIKIGGKQFMALLDTGSDRTFMSEEIYDKLEEFARGKPILDEVTRTGV